MRFRIPEITWTWLRWGARLLAVALIALIAFFMFGEDLWGTLQTTGLDLVEILLFAALGLAIAGLLVALFREGWGGLVVLAGAAVFIAINSLASGRFRLGIFDVGFVLAAVLFLLVAWHERQNQQLF